MGNERLDRNVLVPGTTVFIMKPGDPLEGRNVEVHSVSNADMSVLVEVPVCRWNDKGQRPFFELEKRRYMPNEYAILANGPYYMPELDQEPVVDPKDIPLWHDGAEVHPDEFGGRKCGVLGTLLQRPIYVINKDHLEFGGLPHAMAYGKKMRMYNPDLKGLSKCYWAFQEDIESGLPK